MIDQIYQIYQMDWVDVSTIFISGMSVGFVIADTIARRFLIQKEEKDD